MFTTFVDLTFLVALTQQSPERIDVRLSRRVIHVKVGNDNYVSGLSFQELFH